VVSATRWPPDPWARARLEVTDQRIAGSASRARRTLQSEDVIGRN